jgi:hypothetical protein
VDRIIGSGASVSFKCIVINMISGGLRNAQTDQFSTELALDLLTVCHPSLAIHVPYLLFLPGLSSAGVAQLVEHLICNQRVGGSIPSASSTRFTAGERGRAFSDMVT